MSDGAIPLHFIPPSQSTESPATLSGQSPLPHAQPAANSADSEPHGDVERLASQGQPGPLGAGGVGFSRKLYAAWKGIAATGVPIAALNIVASGVGTAIMQGKDQVVPALRSSGAAAGVTLAADVVLTTAVVAAGHLVLDKKFYKDSTAEDMLKRKTQISAIASSTAGSTTAGVAAQPFGDVLTGVPVDKASFEKELLSQVVGTAVIHAPLALAGAAAWLYKRSRKPSADPAETGEA
jgi:hypothetical protein